MHLFAVMQKAQISFSVYQPDTQPASLCEMSLFKEEDFLKQTGNAYLHAINFAALPIDKHVSQLSK